MHLQISVLLCAFYCLVYMHSLFLLHNCRFKDSMESDFVCVCMYLCCIGIYLDWQLLYPVGQSKTNPGFEGGRCHIAFDVHVTYIVIEYE